MDIRMPLAAAILVAGADPNVENVGKEAAKIVKEALKEMRNE